MFSNILVKNSSLNLYFLVKYHVFLNYVFLDNREYTLTVKKVLSTDFFRPKWKKLDFCIKKMWKLFFWTSQFPGNQHLMLSQTITAIIVLPFLEDLGKIKSVPFLKVAISAGKVGRPSKPYISGKGSTPGSTPAEIGCLSTILS